jgi:hypothetical protein
MYKENFKTLHESRMQNTASAECLFHPKKLMWCGNFKADKFPSSS